MGALLNDPAFWAVILFLVPLALKVPIGISLCLASVAVTWYWDLGVVMTTYNYFANIAKFPLLAIPFFILAGNIMDRASIADKIVNLLRYIFGHMVGGLAIAAICVATFWGAISGSTAATVAAIGVVLIPGMVKVGYDRAFSTAVICAASGLAIIIPPSITFIMYAVITGVSVGAIFAAGFVPGVVIALCLIVSAYITCRRNGYRGEDFERSPGEFFKILKDALWALMTPVIILGGIYGGVFTPTEAAAVSCFYGLFVGVFIYKRIDLRGIYELLAETVKGSATIMFICASAGLYAWVGSTVGLIEKSSDLLLGVSSNEYVILLMIYVILFFGGMLLDGVSILYVFMPILTPIMSRYGWDPVWFGVMVTVMVAIGTITPPVAMNLYVGCRISGITIEELTPPVIPLIAATLAGLLILSLFPKLTLFLPTLLGLM
jgi:C4-dicarboxylate transporter DctM subunit